MTTLIASSVVRGTQQGDSHGGVYLVDLKAQEVEQVLDWNTMDINWHGRGADRGLRGIAFAGDTVFIAASDELMAFDRHFKLLGAWRNPFLKHCHEISVHQRQVFLTSTGYDCILAFDIEQQQFHWALHVEDTGYRYEGKIFDPRGDEGPLQLNKLHINSVVANDDGMYIAGVKSGGLIHFNGKKVNLSASLPAGTHNAQPYGKGVLFNDTQADCVRFASRDPQEDRAFKVPVPAAENMTGKGLDDSRVARPGFGRGLCVLGNGLLAAGSSPSTISVHDLKSGKTILSVMLSTDVRNAIHGLEVWPF
ncbi:hypothetical protein F0M18_18095 [Pseudohalioglobus sediminis]|uniref:Uncharacterized protein n=1 Tax=Pseudohalioglobus sediminis TaxID=2606449 RepID=A0A5B0WR56_9GAMM|nr:hypothetical protein [Pseudohalioglobus sediminis]KAA1188409.1 hypothetical protein F0M18_18095 [Pseudohalioglobus sediminis]